LSEYPTPEEAAAAKRYTVMNLVRLAAIPAVIAGLAIAQGTLDLPYALGLVLVAAGLFVFFFVPSLLAKRWKSADRGEK